MLAESVKVQASSVEGHIFGSRAESKELLTKFILAVTELGALR